MGIIVTVLATHIFESKDKERQKQKRQFRIDMIAFPSAYVVIVIYTANETLVQLKFVMHKLYFRQCS